MTVSSDKWHLIIFANSLQIWFFLKVGQATVLDTLQLYRPGHEVIEWFHRNVTLLLPGTASFVVFYYTFIHMTFPTW